MMDREIRLKKLVDYETGGQPFYRQVVAAMLGGIAAQTITEMGFTSDTALLDKIVSFVHMIAVKAVKTEAEYHSILGGSEA